MKFTLSGDYVNSTYADENGRIIYKVQTTSTLPGGYTNILKVLPDDIPRRESLSLDTSGGGRDYLGDRFIHIARIDWKSFHIFSRGEDIPTKTLFRKEGWNRNRIFMGDDGREYKWVLGPRQPELQLNDETKTQVAKYHQRNVMGIFGEKRPGVLEIFPEGESMMDTIMMTFVYIETARRRER
ncbi:hypothetical protein L218DRAFT_942779 [Marasmius fiardii PR-910]|nr:hypothetical protein L218DRAFT_942779 [Marasmius fiardii PR-910]